MPPQKRSEAENDHSEVLHLEGFLPFQLSVLSDTVSQSLARLYSAQYDIAIADWRVIANLGECGTMTAAEIGHRTRMHKTKVSRSVRILVDKGLVERTRNDADHREALLHLTDQGRAIYEEIIPAARAFNEALIGTLSPQEREVLTKVLKRLDDRSRQLARSIAEDRFR
ncbi:MarR family winged helix-turn-helix transcriptional regulator [Amorphus orientalis]|uniref:DNA-binding MarR family transcriptional regulator n=1 Tax=Amorphus orientalis TaxID=649198 RepID=A0AAE4AT67_9HYPH|nr:MarR family winged helix-turn-helix transcriptional regulator [Amorphus orientalis]MDQ0315958.1 DNA-binding MarR family transcriptional regulator [Amorphus orientalis]